jgi:hypothetical protein
MHGAVRVVLNEIMGTVLFLPLALVGYLLGEKMGKTTVLLRLIELCELIQNGIKSLQVTT